MTVSQIIRLNRNKSKVLLDQDLTLILYAWEMRRYHITEGAELSDAAYQELLEQELKPRAKKRVVDLLLISDRTEKQLFDRLTLDGYPEEAIQTALELVKKHHYLDDEAYGRRYAEYKSTAKSRRQLQFDMKKKGFDEDLISQILEEQPIDEEEQVRTLLRKKGLQPGVQLDRAQYQKLAGMLARKGYGYEVISRALRGYLNGNEETDIV